MDIQKFIDENALVIVGVIAITVVAMTANMNPEAKDIVNTVVGGLIGYLSKSK